MNKELLNNLAAKASLKQEVYKKTQNSFKLLKEAAQTLAKEFKLELKKQKTNIQIIYVDRNEFEFELKFAGDVLIFTMHTNVFEFSRYHEVMRTHYVREDKDRSYCGIINIYNFLSDSFKYKRMNDIGYMIGRVFVNKDEHYFIEGKKEIGMLYNTFGNAIINKEEAIKILESAVLFTINFDLLTPPYDNVKEVSLFEFKSKHESLKKPKTGKRLGFQFKADMDDIES
jgi:predicted acetyltransferase